MFKIGFHKYRFWILQIIPYLANIGYLVKPLSNHLGTVSLKNLENISNFQGWGLIFVAYKKN